MPKVEFVYADELRELRSDRAMMKYLLNGDQVLVHVDDLYELEQELEKFKGLNPEFDAWAKRKQKRLRELMQGAHD